VLVAVGGQPTIPDNIPGADLGIDSDGFFELEALPRKTVVVGAGYIAVEMAGILSALGSDVSLVIRYDKVLRTFDSMISDCVTEEMEHAGVKIIKNSGVSWHKVSIELWNVSSSPPVSQAYAINRPC
jgi:glutathione reductase (NADPH)